MSRICVVCGRKILRRYRKVFCSNLCRYKMNYPVKEEKKRTRKETLCWSCDNACGGCSWSKALIPVSGWDAKPIKIKGNMDSKEYTDSYIVNSCPLFCQTKRVREIEEDR